MTESPKCPYCGKPMSESKGWKGLWMCPDSRKPLNDAPPFEYKCTGSRITDEGVQAFEQEVLRQQIQRN